ncbi:MAG: MCE family protein [Campylobacterales bacterium]
MEPKNNTLLIGLFTVVLTVALALFVLWMGRYGKEGDYVRYTLHFKESVAGLQKNSAVRYMGVAVGRVDEMRIHPSNPDEIEVIILVARDTPITTATEASLKVFGVTGLTFIELKNKRKDAPRLTSSNGEPPVITTAPSMLSKAEETITRLAGRTSQLLDNINKLLSHDNSQHIHTTLVNVAKLSQELRLLTQDLRRLATKSVDFEENGVATLKSARDAFDETHLTMKQLRDRLEKADPLIQKAEHLLNEAITATHRIHGETLPQTHELLLQMRDLAATLHQLAKKIEENPQQLFFDEKRESYVPGEEP